MELRVTPDEHISTDTLRYRCALGKAGIAPAGAKREGDGATPSGTFPIRSILYRPDRITLPPTQLPIISITPTLGWCDDPSCSAYNTLVTLPHTGSYEALWREDHVYDIILPLGYNDDPPIPGNGSAIFVHIAREGYPPTAGCVALTSDAILKVIQKLSPASSMTITT